MNALFRIGACAGLALAIATPALSADATMRIAHGGPADPFRSNTSAMAAVFKSLVESATNGDLLVELYPSGQLGRDTEQLDQVRSGLVESTMASAGATALHYPLVAVFDLPFAFPNIEIASKVIDKDSPFGKKFVADLEEKTGLKTLGLIDSGGFFAFANSRRPIKTVEDMDGLAIRTMTLPSHQALISALGAKPVPLSSAEVYTALQTGTVDGAMNPIPVMSYERYNEVQDYLSLSNHVITPTIWVINRDFYEGLSDEHRKVVDWAADVAADAGRGINRIIEASDAGLPHLTAQMEVNAIPPEELERFAEATQPAVRALITEEYGEEGAEMLKALLDNIEAEK